MPLVLHIALLSPPWCTLTWLPAAGFPDTFWQKGLRVAVPLGRKSSRAGVILGMETSEIHRPDIKFKPVIWPLESSPVLDQPTLGMITELGVRQGEEPGYLLGHILPAGLRQTKTGFLWEHREYSLLQLSCLTGEARDRAVADFIKGLIRVRRRKNQDSRILACLHAPPWPLRPTAVRQKEIMECIWRDGAMTRTELSRKLGFDPAQPLKKLLQAHLLAESEPPDEDTLLEDSPPPFELNAEQKDTLGDLVTALESGSFQCRLLFGITGSGKTAVYQELAKKSLACGKNVILLAPEVALAQKLRKDFQAALPQARIFFYNGYQTGARRSAVWEKVAEEQGPFILVGTRSAIFLPVSRPGCIILDEEHDASYKQDENFVYHAKDLAWYRARHSRCLLVLGSATPDIRTFCASEAGRIRRLELKTRTGLHSLPPVEIINIGKSPVMGIEGNLLCEHSRKALLECAASGEQAVILLNRRGYAPMIFCLECGKTLRCPHCAIGLAYHKDIGRLVCHYCDYAVDYPSPCPECGHMKFLSIGEGTERLTENLEKMIGREILRLDRDNTRMPGRIESILEDFAANRSPFLAGTQMLSKGHHFPNVTLVVVADGDVGLNFPDYRAAEKTFQLLVQAAGRAGRGLAPGRVIIQTRTPDHYCWEYVRNYDYRGFYAEELKRRKRLSYPPFIKLGLLRFSYPAEDREAENFMPELCWELRNFSLKINARLLGPATAPIAMLRGQKRYQCLIKSPDWQPIRDIYFHGLKLSEKLGQIRIILDLDPVNML